MDATMTMAAALSTMQPGKVLTQRVKNIAPGNEKKGPSFTDTLSALQSEGAKDNGNPSEDNNLMSLAAQLGLCVLVNPINPLTTAQAAEVVEGMEQDGAKALQALMTGNDKMVVSGTIVSTPLTGPLRAEDGIEIFELPLTQPVSDHIDNQHSSVKNTQAEGALVTGSNTVIAAVRPDDADANGMSNADTAVLSEETAEIPLRSDVPLPQETIKQSQPQSQPVGEKPVPDIAMEEAVSSTLTEHRQDGSPNKEAAPNMPPPAKQDNAVTAIKAADKADKADKNVFQVIKSDTTAISKGNENQEKPAVSRETSFSQLFTQVNASSEKTTAIEQPADVSLPQADANHIIDQVVEQARVQLKPRSSEMIIKLKPEHLGELTLKVVVDSGNVSATFHSNNAEVRSIIEANLSQLKQEISNTGLKINYVGVYAGLGDLMSNQQQRQSQQPIIKTNSRKAIIGEMEEMDIENIEVAPAVDDGGVDYRI